jgi:hypothetical protein
MIRLNRAVGSASGTGRPTGQFADARHAIDEFNSEVRRTEGKRIDDGLPELQFVERRADAEFFPVEEDVAHTEIRRDEAVETGGWGNVRAGRRLS